MPHQLPILQDLLILLLASIPIAFICNRLRLPVIVGFMLTGVVIGPDGLGLIGKSEAVEMLAEIGVVLLMFTIGLEFSLRRIIDMKRIVMWGGGLQVSLTILAVAGLAVAAGRSASQSIFIGFLVALSSTAIVLKTYLDRLELDSPHGRAATGLLIFQDLCIVPMMLMVPILSGREGSSPANIALKLATAAAVVSGIIFATRTFVPFLFHHIVRLRSPEIFIIFVVLVSLGTAWLTSHFGLSMALGAFIAGLVLSESDYSHQIVSDIVPFRDVFNSLFFVSIGMLLSVRFFAAHWSAVIALCVALIIGKALIAALAVRLLGSSVRIAAMAGIGLAQIGEFSFILAKAGSAQGLLSNDESQFFLAASILSMLATPFLIRLAPRIGYALQTRLTPGSRFEPQVAAAPKAVTDRTEHVIIIGYGMNGRNLAKVLHHVGVPYVVLELNAEVVHEARKLGVPIEFGDAGRREVLHQLGVEKARVLVLAISDPVATRRTTALAREINPRLHIIVRTRYMSELSDLAALGADQVIPEEFETSIEIFSRVLREYGVSRNVIQREAERIRSESYQMLRAASLPLAELDRIAAAFGESATETVFVSKDSPTVGRTLGDLNLRKRTGATVTAAVRDNDTVINLGPDYRIEADDILVLLGNPRQVELAATCIRTGRYEAEERASIDHPANN
jgi:CPA2 family monovalent cation:H+ antiporter-2